MADAASQTCASRSLARVLAPTDEATKGSWALFCHSGRSETASTRRVTWTTYWPGARRYLESRRPAQAEKASATVPHDLAPSRPRGGASGRPLTASLSADVNAQALGRLASLEKTATGPAPQRQHRDHWPVSLAPPRERAPSGSDDAAVKVVPPQRDPAVGRALRCGIGRVG
jgi:hypothetical protein